ncbi:MAG: methyltransferase domain-containing protein [Nitrospirota bacterium]|nr:methyltransferase domain-containing protein [Nitrospirota bacterium]
MTTRLNIGCGAVWQPDWINLDIQPSVPSVRQWDATQGLPCGDGEVDVCYASHVVEHLHPADAEGLLRQCHRVLKDRGIVRIVVPDLEAIAREYVSALDRVDRGDAQAACDHKWIVMELLDQMVRTRSGGEMLRYLTSGTIPNEAFVKSRIGSDAEDMMKHGPAASDPSLPVVQRGLVRRLRDALSQSGSITRVARYAREEFAVLLCGALLGRHGSEAIREALFRTSGECHRWMYDRVSLKRLLEQSGFSKIRVCTAFESQIEGFASYGLDVVKGRIRKPDSLFMEGMKQRSSA